VVSGVNVVKRHTKASRTESGRHRLQREAAGPRLERGPARSEGRQADQASASRSSRMAARCASRKRFREVIDLGRRSPWLNANTRVCKDATTRQWFVKASGRRSSAMPDTHVEVPKLDKIVINMGVGEAVNDSQEDRRPRRPSSTLITGQKPVVTKARISIATFKLRENHADRRQGDAASRPVCSSSSIASMNIALPRVRDFRGRERRSRFDGRGNYRDGPEGADRFSRDRVRQDRHAVRGMDIIIRARRRRRTTEAKALLRGFDLPFVQLRPETNMAKTSSSREERAAQAKMTAQLRCEAGACLKAHG
jgi:large subunit ribosomal protein L5